MKLVKELTRFIKCKQCKMIGCIFLVLLVSILIKLSMPDTFEHLNYSFKLKFDKDPLPSGPKITDFDFSINGKQSEPVGPDEPSIIEFKDLEQPTTDIELSISGITDLAKLVMTKLKIAGQTSSSNSEGIYKFTLKNSQYTSDTPIVMTDE
jgi:hypothetical protein